jgi:ABC-type multidrug transport system fused ATPase/permease subunit
VEDPTPTGLPTAQRKRRARAQWGQSTRTVRHLNVWTVAKVSFIFYLLFFGAVVVASVMLWYVANAVGAIQSIEKSVKTLFDLKEFTLHPAQVAAWTSAGGGVLAILGTIGNILAALMYNLISDLVGGVRFQVVDEVK